MSATLILAGAFVVTLIVAAVALDANLTLRAANRQLREDNEGLRDQLKAEQDAAQFWHGVARGYHDAPGTRSSGPRNVLPFGEKGGPR